MMGSRSVILMSFLALLLNANCANSNKAEGHHTVSHAKDEPISATDTLSYHMEVFKEISPYFSGDGTVLDTTFYAARYPVFSGSIDSLIRQTIFIDGEQHASQVAESFLGGFNEYAEDQLGNDNQAFHAWFRDQHCDVVLNVPGFLSLRNAISEYTGGAHGIELEIWTNVDVQHRKILSLHDLFGDTTALRHIVEGYFRKHEQLSDTSSYGNHYFFDEEAFTLADNFGLTRSGILFHYNPYEIKSYAEGPTTFTVPYEALADVMTDRAKSLLNVIK